ncbi:hypothetical protein AOC28_06615 [Polynucleobacter sp. MWH-Adler-W8]|nr:hypothetical protein AOC28_06615 [Polynucleobacter sp. MWH-Adler-W8]
MFAGHGMQCTVNLKLRLSWWIPLKCPLLGALGCKTTIFAKSDDLKWKTRLIGKRCAKSDLQNVDLRATG